MREDLAQAILGMYEAIQRAADEQSKLGHKDQGRRSGITSGKHLDPLVRIIKNDLIDRDFNPDEIFDTGRQCVLPGWFRPTNNWDLLAFDCGELVAAIELKSIGSSFGNNANNRAEESIGSAVDTLEAFKSELFGSCKIPPVMGYVMIVRDCPESRNRGKTAYSPHFPIDPMFENASFLERFRLLCERLRKASLYNAVWFVVADPVSGTAVEPDEAMTYEVFRENLVSGLRIHRAARKGGGSSPL